MIPDTFLDEVRNRVALVDVIGQRVRLRRKGREHVGLCPFHNEKTPSFTVNEEKGFYHCFGCQAHGSLFDFVMAVDGVTFPEAVERLAASVGLEVPRASPAERARAERHRSLIDVLEAATRYFEGRLAMPEGKRAAEMLRERGIEDGTKTLFRLGFADASLLPALKREGIEDQMLVDAGLAGVHENGGALYPRFRDRLIFPIGDRQGRIVGFGGRAIADGAGPKYLNSPETDVFHKGRLLYGLHHARPAVRDEHGMIVVEGYMDVLQVHQAGTHAVVAPLGTALTEQQLEQLWRIAAEPVLFFDGDAAGRRAAEAAAMRALPLIVSGHGLRFAQVTEGEDPDSLVRRHGIQAVRRIADQAIPLSELVWRAEGGDRTLSSPEDRAALHERLKQRAREINDRLLRRHFMDSWSDRIWDRRRSGGLAPAAAPSADRAATQDSRRAEVLLATIINHPGMSNDVAEELGRIAFTDARLERLRQSVIAAIEGGHTEDLASALTAAGQGDELERVLSPDVYAHAFFARPEASDEDALAGWRDIWRAERRAALKTEIDDAVSALGDDPSNDNLARLKALKGEQAALTAEG